jgi:cytochrome c oxidase cbb3-type subunit 3
VKKLTIFLTAAITLIAAGAGFCAAPDLAAAKANYQLFCVKCHGPNGEGNGPAAATLHTKPRNYTDCKKMATITDQTLFNAIKNGGASVGLSADMPAWKQGFDDDDIHNLVAFVRSFCKK